MGKKRESSAPIEVVNGRWLSVRPGWSMAQADAMTNLALGSTVAVIGADELEHLSAVFLAFAQACRRWKLGDTPVNAPDPVRAWAPAAPPPAAPPPTKNGGNIFD